MDASASRWLFRPPRKEELETTERGKEKQRESLSVLWGSLKVARGSGLDPLRERSPFGRLSWRWSLDCGHSQGMGFNFQPNIPDS